jgi:hypothetical protein
MPIDAQDGTPDRFLEVLANPPIALFVKGAHTDRAGTGATGKLVFVRGPADKRCCTIETEEDERGFPGSVGLSFPDICIALKDTSVWTWGAWGWYVLRTGDDAIGLGGPVNTCNQLVVLQQLLQYTNMKIHRSKSQFLNTHGLF